MADVKDDISSQKLVTGKYFWKKSRDHFHDVIYRSHLPITTLSESFQLTLCRETCIQYV